jgi:hypothetical protein
MDAGALHESIAVVCPCLSCRVIDPLDRATWSFEPKAGATPTEIAAGENVIATIPVLTGKNIPFPEFVDHFSNAEYQNLLQARRAAIQSPNPNDMTWVRNWDKIESVGRLIVGLALANALKATLVSEGILTQARADEIFS